jgi:hypothetical protein
MENTDVTASLEGTPVFGPKNEFDGITTYLVDGAPAGGNRSAYRGSRTWATACIIL